MKSKRIERMRRARVAYAEAILGSWTAGHSSHTRICRPNPCLGGTTSASSPRHARKQAAGVGHV